MTSVIAVSICLALALAACGSSGSDKSSGNGSGGSGGGGSCHLDQAPKIALLWEVKGESANAVDDYQNAAELAVQQINAAGGVCGQKLDAPRVSSSVTDPQKAVAAYLEAVDKSPSLIIGPISETAFDAVLPSVERSQVPTIGLTPDNKPPSGRDGGSTYAWLSVPPSGAQASESAQFASEKLHAKKLGFVGTNESNGNNSLQAIKKVLQGTNASLGTVRQYAPGTQDLTSQVLAMKGSDAIMAFGYPNDVGLAARQLQQNGNDAPVFGGGSMQLAAISGLIKGKTLDRMYGDVPCEALAANTPALASFAKAYRAKHPSVSMAFSNAVVAYDTVKLGAAAIEAAGSTDPSKVNDELKTIDFKGGACQPAYHADGSHYLAHQLVIAHYAANGSAKVEQTFKVPARPAGGTPS